MQGPDNLGTVHKVAEAVKETLHAPLHVPFSASVEQKHEGHKVNPTRIVEAVIIGAVTALMVYILSVPKLEQQIANQGEQIREIKVEIQGIRADFYKPFSRPPTSQVQPKQEKKDNG